MITNAQLSDCRTYRYALWRIWDDTKPIVMFIGLNPSTADEKTDDKTIERCISFSKSWGYGGLSMGNLFAYRTKDPSIMFNFDQPIGSDNDIWLQKLRDKAKIIVAAWGNDGIHMGRSSEVKKLFPILHYLKINKSGEPAHPLYLPKDTVPKLFKETLLTIFHNKVNLY